MNRRSLLLPLCALLFACSGSADDLGTDEGASTSGGGAEPITCSLSSPILGATTVFAITREHHTGAVVVVYDMQSAKPSASGSYAHVHRRLLLEADTIEDVRAQMPGRPDDLAALLGCTNDCPTYEQLDAKLVCKPGELQVHEPSLDVTAIQRCASFVNDYNVDLNTFKSEVDAYYENTVFMPDRSMLFITSEVIYPNSTVGSALDKLNASTADQSTLLGKNNLSHYPDVKTGLIKSCGTQK